MAGQAALFWGVIFASIGFGFFLYGTKQRVAVPMACGVALMMFPFFVSNALLLVAIGALLVAIPYYVRL